MNKSQREILIDLHTAVIDSRIDLITFIEKIIFEYANMEDSELKTSITPLMNKLNAYFIEYGDNELISEDSLAKTSDVFEHIESTYNLLNCC